eukprot:TRINITY_DN51103_c0_g1_i3.p1 TRINITY_DN51103_c0_g1~~TRINITY_DN51103_c0_g1_i3.p1  ORF type:complete len:171 (+),score=13.94 TRINITY_DN51103_c0_g1_i3:280-792(+)
MAMCREKTQPTAPHTGTIPLPFGLGLVAVCPTTGSGVLAILPREETVGAVRHGRRLTAAVKRDLKHSLDRCAKILRASSPTEVSAILQDLASIMLAHQNNSIKLVHLGPKLSQGSFDFLNAKRIGLKALLLSYMEDFHCEGRGRMLTVSYVHQTVKTSDWHIYYVITVNL